MRYQDFDRMVRGMVNEIPEEFRSGVSAIEVSPRTVAHPEREGIYTLGECDATAGDVDATGRPASRIVLYHGSFQALADDRDGFDWAGEAWETLTHELRHHLEWRAGVGALEAFDAAAEENFARLEGGAPDPVFFLDGEPAGEGRWRIDDDVFLDHIVTSLPETLVFSWAGRDWRLYLPPGMDLPVHVTVLNIADPPEGDLVVVLRQRPRWRDLFRRGKATQLALSAELDI